MFSILGNFLPFCLASTPKSENFKTMKKVPGDIIILHKCTKNHDHMLYCPWDMAHDTFNCCFSFWAIFSPFTPLIAQNFKKNKKNAWRYHRFTHVHQKLWLDDVRFLRYGGPQVDGRRNIKPWFITKTYYIDFTWHRSQGSLRKGVEKQEFSAFPINFFENKQKLFSSNSIVCTPY